MFAACIFQRSLRVLCHFRKSVAHVSSSSSSSGSTESEWDEEKWTYRFIWERPFAHQSFSAPVPTACLRLVRAPVRHFSDRFMENIASYASLLSLRPPPGSSTVKSVGWVVRPNRAHSGLRARRLF